MHEKCTSLYGNLPITKESWNWLVKSSIPGALSPVLEIFAAVFPDQLTVGPQSTRMFFNLIFRKTLSTLISD